MDPIHHYHNWVPFPSTSPISSLGILSVIILIPKTLFLKILYFSVDIKPLFSKKDNFFNSGAIKLSVLAAPF